MSNLAFPPGQLETRNPLRGEKPAIQLEEPQHMEEQSKMGRPAKPQGERVTRRLMVNLIETDYQRVMKGYDASIHPSKAAYYRARMVSQQIEVKTRNASLDDLIPILIEHNEELRRTGVNLNQLVHHLNTYKAPALKGEVLQLLKMIKQAVEVQQKSQSILHEINEKWLQS